MIVSLYFYLILIYVFVYDVWDDIVMLLFYEMVYKIFVFKYGIDINFKEIYIYMFLFNSYKGIYYIECVLKCIIFKIYINEEWIEMDNKSLKENVFVFKLFGDGLYFLIGGIEIEDVYCVGFDFVEVDIVFIIIGFLFKISIFIDKEYVDFVFVVEIYDINI